MLPLKIKVKKVKGKGRGKELGVPTLNFAVPESLKIASGVYAGTLLVSNKSYPAAIHFGPRPVFDEEDTSLEAYIIISHSGDPAMAGDSRIDERFWSSQNDEMELEIVKFIREIRNFENSAKMVEQIKKDVKEIKKFLNSKSQIPNPI